jgi:ribosomal protein S18 acetylase RimI-like enzyme
LDAPSIALRDERPEDEAFLRELYASTRAEEMTRVPWDDAQKTAFVQMQFQFQRTHYRRYFPDAAFQLILAGDVPIGRLYVAPEADGLNLMDISLLPQYRNRGIGSGLVRQVMRQGEVLGKRVTLHVELDNPAQQLYRRLGFRDVELRGAHIFMEWRPEGLSAAPGAALEGQEPAAGR